MGGAGGDYTVSAPRRTAGLVIGKETCRGRRWRCGGEEMWCAGSALVPLGRVRVRRARTVGTAGCGGVEGVVGGMGVVGGWCGAEVGGGGGGGEAEGGWKGREETKMMRKKEKEKESE